MHTFQEITIDQLEINPFQMIGKEWMLVTAGNEKKANTMTASWGGMGIMWGKNVVYVFIRDSRFTKEFIDREGMFSLSFPKEEYRKEMKFLGAVSGRDEDKIKEAGVHVAYHEGVPYIDEGSLVMICRVLSETPIRKEEFKDASIDENWYSTGDYHNMYVAEITSVLAR
ncbi:MAG: flavin reductase family protein [Clostridiaceae bacterium]|nr:flavin reductase family protein [Clostridiaceae bacterium]